jgi:hypothetical protein
MFAHNHAAMLGKMPVESVRVTNWQHCNASWRFGHIDSAVAEWLMGADFTQ